jgi:hypothetical protein
MVPEVEILKLQKMLLKKLVFMPTEIEDKENVSLEGFGSQESMQLQD